MARTGRPPKPLALRILENNPGKRKLPEDIPKPISLHDIPAPPEHLNENAKEHWVYLASKLKSCGILTEIDVYALEHCCTALAIAQEASRKINETSLVLILKNEDGSLKTAVKSPYLAVYTEALLLFEKYGSKLGLSPVDRMRLKGVCKQDKGDEFDEFLRTGKAAQR